MGKDTGKHWMLVKVTTIERLYRKFYYGNNCVILTHSGGHSPKQIHILRYTSVEIMIV